MLGPRLGTRSKRNRDESGVRRSIVPMSSCNEVSALYTNDITADALRLQHEKDGVLVFLELLLPYMAILRDLPDEAPNTRHLEFSKIRTWYAPTFVTRNQYLHYAYDAVAVIRQGRAF